MFFLHVWLVSVHECIKYRFLRSVLVKCHSLFYLEVFAFHKICRGVAAFMWEASAALANVGTGSLAL